MYIPRMMMLSLTFMALIVVGLLWRQMHRACPVHPCDCHVEYSHCVKECHSVGASKKYSACCRLHCLATLEQEFKR